MIGKPIHAIHMKPDRTYLIKAGMYKVADASYIYLKFIHCRVLGKKK